MKKILQKLDPSITGTATVAAVYFAARALGVSKKGAAGFGAGALLVHDRVVDRLWPFNRPPEKIEAKVVKTVVDP